jgi:hypothetical protein
MRREHRIRTTETGERMDRNDPSYKGQRGYNRFKVMHGMEDGLRAALPQLEPCLAEPSPSVAH